MKKTLKTLALAGTIVGLAGAANAAVIDLNVYGSSAQFLYMNANAPAFLTATTANGGRGCSATTQTTAADGKSEITQGTGCDGGVNTINIRYTSKASYDGVRAVNNSDPANTCAGFPGQRPQITGAGNAAYLCQDVTLGASDVSGVSFTQQSHGLLAGPMGGVQTDRVFTGVPTTGLTPYNTVVVPFGFFANSSVKVSTCQGGTNDGNLCTAGTATADCGTGITCGQNTISNLTREQAIQIFSGQAIAWTDFGASYSVTGDATSSIVACFRHAGSGTHATLDYAVMNKNWGNALLQTQNTTGPIAYFNDGSSDEMKCINNNAALATPGAIGYADADQGITSYPNVVALKYNGLFGRRNTIRNGLYDFWSAQWLFENPAKTPTGSAAHQLILDLTAFAKKPANVPATKAAYWASLAEMVWFKGNATAPSDQQYPSYLGATTPQTP
jgi:hypothetical protein